MLKIILPSVSIFLLLSSSTLIAQRNFTYPKIQVKAKSKSETKCKEKARKKLFKKCYKLNVESESLEKFKVEDNKRKNELKIMCKNSTKTRPVVLSQYRYPILGTIYKCSAGLVLQLDK